MNKKINAFTLQEVMLTLLVMGALMALTIPTLYNNISNAGNVAQLKKAYGQVNQATTRLMLNNSGTMSGIFTDSDDMVTKYCDILECNKTCATGTAVSGECFKAKSDIKMLNNTAFLYEPANLAGFVMADGTLVAVEINSTGCTGSWMGIPSICGYFWMDINGFKGPNVYGRDIFGIEITKDNIVPAGSVGTETDYAIYCDPVSADANNGEGCAGRLLNEGAMNY